ncbi:MAG TPA: hypothetical protein VMB50_21575 [Myxococcales bacterium]|jgi:hypothetical protein|nr:hypothetical protein [Myxococcales bacterium]
MIESFKRPPGALRWPPRQRFSLTAGGLEARSRLEAAITSARASEGGRDAQERVEREWATPLGVDPGDGVYLNELMAGAKTAAQLGESLADCGITRVEAQAAIDRLFKAGLLVPEQKQPAA